MKVILDECVPVPLRHEIAGHEVVTSHYMGLGKLRDGALLDEIDGKYDVLTTCNRSIPWQNCFAGRGIAIVILCSHSNRLDALAPLIPKLLQKLNNIKPGEVAEIREG
jgi:hypothetical protein